MKRILVVANETVAGKPLIDAVRARAGGDEVAVHVICPQNQPKHGYVIYDSMVREAAENRLRMTLALLHEAGIEARGEVMDPDPYTAIMDALGEQDYDEIVISTHPETRSGWLREGLVDRVRRAARRPVEHVVVDLDAERDDVKRTLVVANQTVASEGLKFVERRAPSETPFMAAFNFYAPHGPAEHPDRLDGGGEIQPRSGWPRQCPGGSWKRVREWGVRLCCFL
jgi:phosphopantetheine adenylyltransferase